MSAAAPAATAPAAATPGNAPASASASVASGEAGAGKASSGATVSGEVVLAPALAAQLKPDDVLFIVARPDDGSRVPLAVLRKRAGDLPLKFTLDDSLAMVPDRTVSKARAVVLATGGIGRAFKITSNSWGGGPYSQSLYDLIAAGRDLGHLFIAAAGNGGHGTSSLDSPASAAPGEKSSCRT